MSATHRIDRAWKTLARALIERVGGIDAAASVTRVGRAQLSNYQSIEHDQVMPADVAARLEEIAREPIITSELARRAGYALVPTEPMSPCDLGEVLEKLGKEVGEVFSAFATALADGHTTDDERACIARELQDVIAASHRALAAVQAGGR